MQHGADVIRVVKGAPATIAAFAGVPAFEEAEKLAGAGYRVLAVAAGPEQHARIVGFLALLDPPRDDSAQLVANLRALGLRVLMITGDGLATARTVATQVGITGAACSPERLRNDTAAAAIKCNVFAGVLPGRQVSPGPGIAKRRSRGRHDRGRRQ